MKNIYVNKSRQRVKSILITLIVSFFVIINVYAEEVVKKFYDADLMPNGDIGLVYISEGMINYAIYDPDTNEWNKSPVIAGKDVALDIDQNGNPHLAYITNNDDLGYTYYNGSEWAASTIIDSINFNDSAGIITAPDITIDSSGKAHISYYDSKGGYTSGNSYLGYDKDDLVYATNESGVFVIAVRTYSQGDTDYGTYYSQQQVLSPAKIATTNDGYYIGAKYYTFNRTVMGNYKDYTHTYKLYLESTNTPNEYSYPLGTTSSVAFNLYAIDSSNTNVYSLFKKSSALYVTNGVTEIAAATKDFTGNSADLFVNDSDSIYYAGITTNDLLLYQNGNYKENITLPSSIDVNNLRMKTVVSGDKQYVFYNDSLGSIWASNISTALGDMTINSVEMPDKIAVETSGITVSNKIYDGNPITYSGTPLSRTVDTDEIVSIDSYTYTWYDVTNSINLSEAPINIGNYKLIVSVSENNNEYEGTLEIPFSITTKSISIDGVSADNKVYDGTNAVSITGGSLVGLIEGDNVTPNVPATGTMLNPNVGENKAVTLEPITLSGTEALNYSLIQPTDIMVDIQKRDININTVTANDKAYDGTDNSSFASATFDGLQNLESLVLGVDYTIEGTFANSNVGVNKNVSGTITLLDTIKANNYNLVSSSFNTTASINKASGLIATYSSTIKILKSQVRSYTFDLANITLNKEDGGIVSYSLGTLTGPELFSISPTITSGNILSFTSASVASGTATQTIIVSTNNYQDATITLTFELIDKTIVNISGITVSDKIYDGNAINYSGVPVARTSDTNQAVNISEYTYRWYDITNSVYLSEAPINVGNYKLIVSVPSNNPDYDGTVEASFAITPKTITISGVVGVERPYNGTNIVNITGGTLSGVVTGDDVIHIVPTTGSVIDVNAGQNKNISISDITLSGSDANNYVLTQPDVIGTITKSNISISDVVVNNKVYDGTTNALTSSITFNNLQNSEVLNIGTDYNVVAVFADANAGIGKTVTVTVNLLNTSLTNNYNLNTNVINSTANITKASGLSGIVTSEFTMLRSYVGDYSYDLSNIELNKTDTGMVQYSLSTLVGSEMFTINPSIESDNETLTFKSSGLDNGIASLIIVVSSQNYEDTNVTMNFSLYDKEEVSITGVSVTDKIYDGKPILIDGTPIANLISNLQSALVSNYTYTWYDANNTVLETIPTNAGEYKLVISVAESDLNYYGSINIPFIINKKDLIIKPKDYSIYKDSLLPNIDVEYKGITEYDTLGENIVYDYLIQDKNGNVVTKTNVVGVYSITFKEIPSIETDNYNITYDIGKLTIKSKPVIVNYQAKEADTNIQVSGLEENISIPEKKHLNVTKVDISVKVESIKDNKDYSQIIDKANNYSKEKGYTLYDLFDISIIKKVTKNDGNIFESTVSNDDITGPVIVRIPVPEALLDNDNLVVAYIDDDGNVNYLETTIVDIDGQKYLEFETDHFSFYAIMEKQEDLLTNDVDNSNNFDWSNLYPIFTITIIVTIVVLLSLRSKKEDN